eukprot:5607045-Pleurochrysis_carterae.AAC.1
MATSAAARAYASTPSEAMFVGVGGLALWLLRFPHVRPIVALAALPTLLIAPSARTLTLAAHGGGGVVGGGGSGGGGGGGGVGVGVGGVSDGVGGVVGGGGG